MAGLDEKNRRLACWYELFVNAGPKLTPFTQFSPIEI